MKEGDVMPAKKQEMRTTSEPETIIMFHTVTAWRTDYYMMLAIEGQFIDLRERKSMFGAIAPAILGDASLYVAFLKSDGKDILFEWRSS